MKFDQLTLRGKAVLGVIVACVAVLAACGVVTSMSSSPSNPVASGGTPAKPANNPQAETGPIPENPVPEKWTGDPKSNTVYLTFDDGPNTIYTPQILKILKDNGVKATFFEIGNQVTNREDIVRQVKADGHLIGNHTWSHVALTGLSPNDVTYQLSLARKKVDGAGGAGTMGPCMRPPGGAVDETVRQIGEKLRFTTILWNIDTDDWKQPPAAVIKSRILQARAGDIVLMHDGGGNRPNTVEALKEALPILKSRGYKFASIPACASQ